MLNVRVDMHNFSKVLNNVIEYSNGFIEGINVEKHNFNKFLAGYTVEALERYIDSQARMNPEMLHHVYEWNQVGNAKARLFKFNVNATKSNIIITGSFLTSKSANDNGQVFANKAEIMENAISVVVTPKNSSVLVFEDGDETVFTTNSIFIEHPGGDAVANSFGETVNTFFESYFVAAFIQPLIRDLQNASEYSNDFVYGAKGGGRMAGIRAGRKYLDISGVTIE